MNPNPMPRIAYVVHDLNDPAVARRVRMLRAGGADLVAMGFWRGARAPIEIEGAPAVSLGRTADAKLAQRALAVVRNLFRPGAMLAAAAGADVVIGRNLEALALAVRIRRSRRGARLVYECLDIHRTLLGGSRAHRAIQALEARLLRGVDLLIVSSPAFARDYFSRRPTLAAPTLLVENKVPALGMCLPAAAPAPPGPPWTIGWLGNLRCSETLTALKALAARHDGRVEILIAGRATEAVFADFAGEVAAAPHCTYLGPYSPADQPAIYARCHFAWAIDWFEEGLNSSWLLPNRLYEASAFGSVPIALRSVETGRWLEAHGAGVIVDDVAELDDVLTALDAVGFATLRTRLDAIPRTDLFATQADCDLLVAAIQGR